MNVGGGGRGGESSGSLPSAHAGRLSRVAPPCSSTSGLGFVPYCLWRLVVVDRWALVLNGAARGHLDVLSVVSSPEPGRLPQESEQVVYKYS